MIFATPLGLLALLAIPVIVAIHIFRRRFPVRTVAGLFLWQALRTAPEGGGKIDRLPITASLLLECLAALALALILAGARISAGADSEHLVVLLDDSASMAAVNAAGERVRDRAARRVIDELERMGSRARVTLVRSGERPSVLLGPAALALEAGAAFETWTPRAPHHSLALGLRLARELAGNTARLMVVSDVMPDAASIAAPEGALWVALGEALDNVGIIAAQRTLSPEDGHGAILLTLANHATSQTRRSLRVSAAGKEILQRQLELPPGISSLSLPLPPGLPLVLAELSADALPQDNTAVLAEPRPQIVGIENRLPDGRGRDALARAIDAVPGVTRAEPGHLVFMAADALDHPAVPGVWRVGFGRGPGRWIAAGEPRDFVGPFLIEKRHPLLHGVSLDGTVWAGAVPLAAGIVRPLVSVGDQPLIATPLPANQADPTILINLDLARTNLIRSPDWPILISNLAEMRRQNLPGPERWNYRVGEWVRIRLAREPAAPLRVRTGSADRTLPPGRHLEFVAPEAGSLRVLEGDETLFELGVNFLDEDEANLRTKVSAEAGELAPAASLRAESGPASDPLFWILLAIAAAALVSNWCLLPSSVRRV